MTTAVVDSGPLTHLWQIEMWAALGTFTEIHIAEQVAQEVEEHVPLENLQRIIGTVPRIHEVTQARVDGYKTTQPELTLELADLASLVLAKELKPDFVLTDDLALRRAVEIAGHLPMGSVGILLRAYQAGLINAESLDVAIDGLFVHSTLYLSPIFKRYVRELIASALDRGSASK